MSSVKGYGPLAGELEENHHDDDDEKGVEHLDDNDDNKIVKIVKNLIKEGEINNNTAFGAKKWWLV